MLQFIHGSFGKDLNILKLKLTACNEFESIYIRMESAVEQLQFLELPLSKYLRTSRYMCLSVQKGLLDAPYSEISYKQMSVLEEDKGSNVQPPPFMVKCAFAGVLCLYCRPIQRLTLHERPLAAHIHLQVWHRATSLPVRTGSPVVLTVACIMRKTSCWVVITK